MPVKIRLMRIGAKKRPFYRVVAVDERKKRTGAYLELLGTYNPLTEPHEIILKQDRIDEWIKKGAVLSDGYLRIIGKAPQRPPRKPKKEKKEEAPVEAPADASTPGTPDQGAMPEEKVQEPEAETQAESETAEAAPVESQPEDQPTDEEKPAEPNAASEEEPGSETET